MKIMVTHDGSENAERALQKTLELFKSFKPTITLLTVVQGARDASLANEPIFEKQKAERHDFMMATAKKITDKGFDVDAILATGDPREMILEATETKNPDLVVVAKRGLGSFKSMVLGSTSAFLIRHVKCPVLVIH